VEPDPPTRPDHRVQDRGRPSAGVAPGEQVVLAPDDDQGWFGRGEAYEEAGQWEKALAAYSRALAIKELFRYPTERAGYLITRARAFRKAGMWDQAVADYAEALRLEPQDRASRHDLARLLATCPDPEVRNPLRAVELAQKVVEALPDVGR